MFTVKYLPEFERWLNSQTDNLTRIRLSKRLDKAARGLLGDVAPVGSGVFEFREHFGPGWRMYYVIRQQSLIVVLAGGNKATQQQDIIRAIELSKVVED